LGLGWGLCRGVQCSFENQITTIERGGGVEILQLETEQFIGQNNTTKTTTTYIEL